MHLQWLELRDFRSYERLKVDLDSGVNVFFGDNGAGKTNLLEAVAYLSLLRSFRGAPDAALIASGEPAAVLRGSFARPAGETSVEIELNREERRKVLVNGKRPARFRGVAAEIPIVTFLPDDLDVIKRGPAYRRGYLDDLAAQLWPAAAAEQRDYDKALRQRNALLRQEGFAADPESLLAWEAKIAVNGAKVIARRGTVLERLTPHLNRVYAEISTSPADLSWSYEVKGLGDLGVPVDEQSTAASLESVLSSRRRIDQERRVTTIGPHRDEIGFSIAGSDARLLASQGEQRSVALCLRLGAYELLLDQNDEAPILLLDDVLSELDPTRSEAVLKRLPAGQVLITTAREEDESLGGVHRKVMAGVVE